MLATSPTDGEQSPPLVVQRAFVFLVFSWSSVSRGGPPHGEVAPIPGLRAGIGLRRCVAVPHPSTINAGVRPSPITPSPRPVVLHIAGGAAGDLLAVLAADDVERHVDPRGDAG